MYSLKTIDTTGDKGHIGLMWPILARACGQFAPEFPVPICDLDLTGTASSATTDLETPIRTSMTTKTGVTG
jgi:hypothetical protein